MNDLLNRLWLIRFFTVALLLTGGLVPHGYGLGAKASESSAEPSADPPAELSAVVLMYHRFGESGFPSTNTTPAQLEDHIKALQEGGHTVVPLASVVSALKGEGTLPDKAVAITIDDAYRSFLTDGWPVFKAAGMPVTLFVATEGVSAGYGDLLSWDEIRSLQAEGVSLGAHSHSHAHYVSLSAEGVTQDLAAMQSAFETELGMVPSLFAYPYGEAGLDDMDRVRAAGFVAAFGQHSGSAGSLNHLFYLPRFALNEGFGGADRMRLILNTLPLPVAEVSPAEPVIKTNPPQLTLTLANPPPNISGLTCFGPRGVTLTPAFQDNLVTLTPVDSFPSGRSRVNCTLRSQAESTRGRWHWFGWQVIAGFETERTPVHPRFR